MNSVASLAKQGCRVGLINNPAALLDDIGSPASLSTEPQSYQSQCVSCAPGVSAFDPVPSTTTVGAASIGSPVTMICPIIDGCNAVVNSPYSRVFGVPMSYFGFIYYLYMFALAAGLAFEPFSTSLRLR